MKIRINNGSLEDYKNNSTLADFRSSIEAVNTEIEWTDIYEYATEATQRANLNSKYEAAKTIGAAPFKLIGAGVKGAGLALKGTAMAVNALSKGIEIAKREFSRVYPQMLKAMQNFMNNLQGMWAKLLKYDKRFLALGERMRDIVQNGGIESVRTPLGATVTIRHHEVAWDAIASLVKWAEDFAVFVNHFTGFNIKNANFGQGSNHELINNLKLISIEELTKSLQGVTEPTKRIEIINSACKMNNNVIGLVNKEGPVKVLFENYIKSVGVGNYFVQPLKSLFGRNDIQMTKKYADNPSNSMASVVEFIALGGENPVVEKTFKSHDRNAFVAYIKNSNYTKTMASYLSGTDASILANSIKNGAGSANKYMKNFANNFKKAMEVLIKDAEKFDKERVNAGKENELRPSSKPTIATNLAGNASGNAATSTIEPDNDSIDNKNEEAADKMSSGYNEKTVDFPTEIQGLNDFANTYIRLLGICSNMYSGLIKGLCLVTYILVEEGESICNTVDTLRGGDVPKYGSNEKDVKPDRSDLNG